MIGRPRKELVHITETRCGECYHLRRAEGSYTCPRNRRLPEQVEPYFAKHCPQYDPKWGWRTPSS